MKINKSLLGRIVGIALVSLSCVSITIATLAWFAAPGGKTQEHLDGVIGLRGYFYAGDGKSSSTAFEIVSPNHFYNLSRLQNLGIFTEKTYFQVGHKDEITGKWFCLDESGVKHEYLDMQSFCSRNTIRPIGSEETPFIGEFEGNGIPIKNLTIKGNPEDIGVFGYVSHEGKVKGLVCSHLDVHSLGYHSTVENLFGQDVDNIFDSTDYLSTETSFYVQIGANNTELKSRTSQNYNAALGGGYCLTNLEGNLIGDTKVYGGAYFYPSFPNNALHPDDRFSYSWKSSSGLLRADDVDPNRIVIDLANFPLNTRAGATVEARLSLVASTKEGEYTYSRVIQSYSFDFSLDANRIYKCVKEGGSNRRYSRKTAPRSIPECSPFVINSPRLTKPRTCSR